MAAAVPAPGDEARLAGEILESLSAARADPASCAARLQQRLEHYSGKEYKPTTGAHDGKAVQVEHTRSTPRVESTLVFRPTR